MTSQPTQSRKTITWNRVRKNLLRIVKNCTPPILHGPLGWKEELQGEIVEGIQSRDSMSDPVEFNLPVTHPNQLWPGFDETPISMVTRQIRNHLWAMPENELMVLSAICQMLKPRTVFEFGTFTGASTLAIASNTPADTKIHTLDIPPKDRKSHRTGVGSDIPFEFEIGQAFRQTQWEKKITVHTGDTRQFDVADFQQKVDLVFIDADHTYPFVKNDTEKAIEMLKPGGLILWHDYRWDDDAPECAGVTRWVNEFYESVGGCYEIEGTRFAIFDSAFATGDFGSTDNDANEMTPEAIDLDSSVMESGEVAA